MENKYIGIKEGVRDFLCTSGGNKGLIFAIKEDGKYYYTNFVGFSKRLETGFTKEEIEHDLNNVWLIPYTDGK